MTTTLTPAPATTTSSASDPIATDPTGTNARPVARPTTRSAADTARAIPSALKSEWIKLSTVRSNAAILALTVAAGGFIAWAVGNFVTEEVLTVMEIFTFSTVFTAVFAAVAGILVFSSEAQHGTLGLALTAQPTRSVLATSKTVIASAMGAAIGLAGIVAGFAGAYLSGIEVGDTANLISTSAWAIGFASIAAVLGLGVGMIARHSTAAISGILVWWLVVENLVSVFLAERFARFMPFTAGNGMLGAGAGPESQAGDLALSTVENTLVFGGYALAAVLIGTVLLYRRDNN